ncbi:MAG TPA: sialidase family protein [Bryobacteraceae bacterium]|nr:sialidase family protein [Bryobacteraceae bacterium]
MLQLLVARVMFGVMFSVILAAAPQHQFIYEQAPFPSCHAATIVETTPGVHLAAWFGGEAEGRPDVAIWGARLENGRWSAPFELVREPKIATYNPVLFYSKDGTLWLYYKFGPHPTRWSAGRISSRDHGQTWTSPEHLPAGIYGPIKNKPHLLRDGTVVSGTSVESHNAWTSWVERSTDNAKTWTKHGPVEYPGDVYASIQPAIVPLANGRLRMFVRTTDHIGRIAKADSKDGGRTWTPLTLTDLPNPNSGIDAVALRDGRIVMAYNHTKSGRSPLNLAVSADGDRWQMFLALETEPGEFSYPSLIQSRDGSVDVVYTWNRKRIKHVRVPLADIPSGKE